MWHLFHQQWYLKQLIYCGNHTNIMYPELFIQYCENCFFILNTFTFYSTVDNIFWTNSFHYVIFSCNARLQWIWLDHLGILSMEKLFFRSRWCSVHKNFSYSLKNYSILLKKFYIYNPRNYEHLTQVILPLLPKKLRTPYSRNFTFITQEITNTLLKKFEGPYPC